MAKDNKLIKDLIKSFKDNKHITDIQYSAICNIIDNPDSITGDYECDFYDKKELAEILGITTRTLDTYRNEKKIHSSKMSKRKLVFTYADVKEYCDKNELKINLPKGRPMVSFMMGKSPYGFALAIMNKRLNDL